MDTNTCPPSDKRAREERGGKGERVAGRTWSNEDLRGSHDSTDSPSHVPRSDRHTLPSSYMFGFSRCGSTER